MVATCSGQRSPLSLDRTGSRGEESDAENDSDDEETDEQGSIESRRSLTQSPRQILRTPDNSIKVWSL